MQILIQQTWGGGGASAFLTSSQLMLTMDHGFSSKVRASALSDRICPNSPLAISGAESLRI